MTWANDVAQKPDHGFLFCLIARPWWISHQISEGWMDRERVTLFPRSRGSHCFTPLLSGSSHISRRSQTCGLPYALGQVLQRFNPTGGHTLLCSARSIDQQNWPLYLSRIQEGFTRLYQVLTKLPGYESGRDLGSVFRDCLCPVVLTRGSDQMAVSTKFDMRNDDHVIRNYGRMLIELSGSIPDGIVCFFVSYSYMDQFVSKWNEMGILQVILISLILFSGVCHVQF